MEDTTLKECFKNFFEKIEEYIGIKTNGWSEIKIEYLSDCYFEFFNFLKEKKGTSAQFTGFSEYLLSLMIRKFIERKIDCKFKNENLTEQVSYWKHNDIVLIFDTRINKKNLTKLRLNEKFEKRIYEWIDQDYKKRKKDKPRAREGCWMQPDVAILKGGEIIALMQLKINVDTSSISEDVNNQIEKIISINYKFRPYFLYIVLQASESQESKAQESAKGYDRMYIINKENSVFQEILEKIVKELKQ